MGLPSISMFSQIWTKIWKTVHNLDGQEPLENKSSPSAIVSQISNNRGLKSMESCLESHEGDKISALNPLQGVDNSSFMIHEWTGKFFVSVIIGTGWSAHSSRVWWFLDIIAVCILLSECYVDVNFLTQFWTKMWELFHNWYEQQSAKEPSSSAMSVSLSKFSSSDQSPPVLTHMDFHSELDQKVEGDSSYGLIRSVQVAEDSTDKVEGDIINAINRLQGVIDFTDKVSGDSIYGLNRFQGQVENSIDKAERESMYALNRLEGVESSNVKVEGNSMYVLNKFQGVKNSTDKEGGSICALKRLQGLEVSIDKVEGGSMYAHKRFHGVEESSDKVEGGSMYTHKRLRGVEESSIYGCSQLQGANLDSNDKSKGDSICLLNKLQEVEEHSICALNQEPRKIAETTLLSVSFNQDFSNIVFCTSQGVSVYNSQPFGDAFSRDFGKGGISIAEKVYQENILVFVGSDGNTQYPPNKVIIWDDNKQQCIHEITFESKVQAVKARWDYIVPVLENEIHVYKCSQKNVALLHKVETLPNPLGLCAISDQSTTPVLACPGLKQGNVHVEHYGQKDAISISAHNSHISCLALSRSGDLLATSSTKGTVIRIFSTFDGTCLQKLRRGTKTAEIYSIALSPTARWLALSSDKGSVHIFGLDLKVEVADKDPSNERVKPRTSLPFKKGILSAYSISKRSFARFHYSEKKRSVIGFGQHNTIMIVGLDGSFYRYEFDPENGGEMVQKEHLKFLEETPK